MEDRAIESTSEIPGLSAARHLAREGRWREAVDAAHEWMPGVPSLYVVMALLGQDADRNVLAEGLTTQLRQLAALEPENARWHRLMAAVFGACERLLDGLAAAREAVRLEPDHPDGLHLLCRMALSKGLLPEASEAARRLMSVDPDSVPGLAAVAECEFYSDRFEEAVTAADRALDRNGLEPLAWGFRGASLARLRRFPGALASLSNAVRLVPDWDWAAQELVRASAEYEAQLFSSNLPGGVIVVLGSCVLAYSANRLLLDGIGVPAVVARWIAASFPIFLLPLFWAGYRRFCLRKIPSAIRDQAESLRLASGTPSGSGRRTRQILLWMGLALYLAAILPFAFHDVTAGVLAGYVVFYGLVFGLGYALHRRREREPRLSIREPRP
jgi:tetratricopeptide (TPR) repeat protein